MYKLDKNELCNTVGGGELSSALINSVYKVVSFVYELGEAFGSFIRRSSENKMCDL